MMMTIEEVLGLLAQWQHLGIRRGNAVSFGPGSLVDSIVTEHIFFMSLAPKASNEESLRAVLSMENTGYPMPIMYDPTVVHKESTAFSIKKMRVTSRAEGA